MRVSKTNKLLRPVNKLYLVGRFSYKDIDVNTDKPRRETAVIRELNTFSPFWRLFDIATIVQWVFYIVF